ncbi:Meh1 protein [Maudiozyma humilis]|uniref:Meh1 protein n=1 Tax=Maudiozyma humilis TaxID=51915 RepID=A0AAV5RSS3_MAUHU|nr:Meh1 protein [Kazachstania humilis]
MGAVLSCCQGRNSAEEESLLRSQQAGYGANGVHDNDNAEYIEQQKQQEAERIAQLRENELRNIVNNTNDKLIDISMISNSGIVVNGDDQNSDRRGDLYDRLDADNGDDNHLMPKTSNLAAIMSNSASIHYPAQQNDDNIDDDRINSQSHDHTAAKEEAVFTPLDTKTQLSEQTREALRTLLQQTEESLKSQLTIEAPKDLVIDF